MLLERARLLRGLNHRRTDLAYIHFFKKLNFFRSESIFNIIPLIEMNIKRFSQITDLSAHTLRYYEKIGLLLNIRRDPKGYRDYSEKDVTWVEFLKRLKATGMPLNEMKIFAKFRYQGDSTVNERLKILEKHHLRIKERIEDLLKHKDRIEEKIEIYKNWGN